MRRGRAYFCMRCQIWRRGRRGRAGCGGPHPAKDARRPDHQDFGAGRCARRPGPFRAAAWGQRNSSVGVAPLIEGIGIAALIRLCQRLAAQGTRRSRRPRRDPAQERSQNQYPMRFRHGVAMPDMAPPNRDALQGGRCRRRAGPHCPNGSLPLKRPVTVNAPMRAVLPENIKVLPAGVGRTMANNENVPPSRNQRAPQRFKD